MKKGIWPRLLAGITATCSLALTLSAITMAWFTTPGGSTDDEILDGEVGLRGYFYRGDGSEDRPYEIVSPIHFYNLTRLQNLGVFPEKRYFQIGHDFNGTYGCLDNNGNVVQYLDMEDFSNATTILPIGGEGAPFVGDFDGHGIPVKNLKIQGYPEDIGVFGYVSYEGAVKGLVCDNLEIHSLGYTQTPADTSTQLFGQDIDDIFDENADYLATDTTVSFVDYNTQGDIVHLLKNYNGAGGYYVNQCNLTEKLIASDSTIYNGYFDLTFPDVANDPFIYSWRSSSSLIKEAEMEVIGGDIKKVPVIDFTALRDSGTSVEQREFNCGEQMQVDARLSLIASVEIGGFTYSRVIQTYKIEFFSNGSIYNEGKYSYNIYCDYLDQGRLNDKFTDYHHGNNIGFLAGHVDGKITDSFVYRGKLVLNDNGNCHEIKTESETGLIGEIGTNVVNSLDPDYGLTTHGDTGIINFTKIYDKIRTDVVQGETTMAGKHTFADALNGGAVVTKYYISYENYKNSETFNLFKPYLRHYPDENESVITSVANPGGNNSIDSYNDGTLRWHTYQMNNVKNSFNSVDFLWNSVIQDDIAHGEDRGLGVFKIVANYENDQAAGFSYGEHFLDGVGDCRIMNGNPYTKVYFSTCEYDHTKSGQIDWDPLRPSTLPSYSDEKSFEYPFSRDYNYCFELDLAQMDYSGGKNYMFNTDSTFLQNYLKSKLIDKFGGTIEPQNPKFGFMFRNSEYESVTSLSSYMDLHYPLDKANFGTAENPVYYPRRSIVFDIDNENGANVSVIGGGSADLSIFTYDPTTSSGGVSKLYTMRCRNDSTVDSMRYFTYTLSNGETSGQTTTVTGELGDNMTSSGYLFGHIFKLPKGHYVLGSADQNNTANVYFLCVQGQTDANIGDNTQAAIGSAVTDVDFLLEPPTYSAYPNSLARANFNFRSNFNLMLNKEFQVDVIEENSSKYLSLSFERNPDFVTYLLLVAIGNDPKYYVNNVAYTQGTKVLIQP